MSSESLQTLFSDSSKNNYARLFKPVEFVKKNKVHDTDFNEITTRKKKPKHKHRDKDNIVPQASGGGESTSVDEKDQRTCFVGNISTTENRKTITKCFRDYGDIESIRLRSVPIEGTAVDEDGNQNLVKRICSNKQKFGDQKGSFNAYVVFKEVASVKKAVLAMNNRLLGDRHLRVDHCIPSVLDPKSTVFLGSLPFYADEEELRGHFAAALAGGHEDIASVRIIRDPETLIGKGIAYVSFNNHDAVLKALTLDQSKFRKRNLRISTCGKRTKRSQQRVLVANKSAGDELPETQSSGTISCNSALVSKKRKRSGLDVDTPAARRIQMKKSLVKQQGRGKTFNANKKKGKLGGVIKKAIKKPKNHIRNSKRWLHILLVVVIIIIYLW